MSVLGTCFPPEPHTSWASGSSCDARAAAPSPCAEGQGHGAGTRARPRRARCPWPPLLGRAAAPQARGAARRQPPPALPLDPHGPHPGGQPLRQRSLTLALVSGASKQIKKGSVDGGQMGHCSPQRGRRVAERAVGQPKLTGESSRLVPPPGRHARAGAVVQDWRRGASPPRGSSRPAVRPFRGEGRLVSAAGCLYPTSLCLPGGCGSSRGGPGQRAPVQLAGSESSLCALTGDQSRSSWTLWTESLQPAACRTSSKVSLLHLCGLRDFPAHLGGPPLQLFWGCQPEARGVGRTHPRHPSGLSMAH